MFKSYLLPKAAYRRVPVVLALFCCMAVTAAGHDLFIRCDSYFSSPNSTAFVSLMNGSFRKSEGCVKRERLRDASLVTPSGKIVSPPMNRWSEKRETTRFDLDTSEPGTYIVAVSTKPKDIELKAADFNHYLDHDGLPDILAARKKNGELNKDAKEQYSKHVKAIFQVGQSRTDSFKTPLNYPVEIIPRQNPYDLKVGDTIEVLCTRDGNPIINQFVMAGWEKHSGETPPFNTRTDANGIARFELKKKGKWFIKFIHMDTLDDPIYDYESKWATLSFEIR
jgi:uncharacterized GH25 family protein